MKTTLNQIRKHSPCTAGWKKLLSSLGKTKSDDEEVSIIQVLDSNGLDDALWTLRAVKGRDKEIRLFAVWCARQVQHLMTDKRSINALDVAEKFANGEVVQEELSAARDAAGDAARDAAGDAARDAAWAAARAAAWAAARAAAGDAAWAAAGAAAGDAARDAAGDAAGDAARDAAGDAARDAARAAAWAAARAAARAAAGAAAWDAAGAAAWAAAMAAQEKELRRVCASIKEKS